MKRTLVLATTIALGSFAFTGSTTAGPIERACLSSGAASASRALCGCIQQAADMTLKSGDQNRAAKFFRNPDKAHATWASQSASDDAFWERYKNFGATAEANCAG